MKEQYWILIAAIIVFCGAFGSGYKSASLNQPQIELYYPELDHGARIPGTNYSVDGKDTLEIVKSVNYNYRVLSKAERAQAREYIKSLRK
jgi:hypothetical protein